MAENLEPMEHTNSSRDHLETWSNLTKLFVWGSAITAVVLLIMAATLTP